MKRLALGISILAALAVSSAAVASPSLVGKYSTKVASPAQFKGTWILTFTKAGTYTVADAGHIVVYGKYSLTASTVTLGHETGPAACTTTGKYAWTRSGKSLKLRRTSASAACTGRDLVLAHTFTKVG